MRRITSEIFHKINFNLLSFQENFERKMCAGLRLLLYERKSEKVHELLLIVSWIAFCCVTEDKNENTSKKQTARKFSFKIRGGKPTKRKENDVVFWKDIIKLHINSSNLSSSLHCHVFFLSENYVQSLLKRRRCLREK